MTTRSEERQLHYEFQFNSGFLVVAAGLQVDDPILYSGRNRRRGGWPKAIPPNVLRVVGDNWAAEHPR